MHSSQSYTGVIPAFYACYDDDGNISEARTRALARWLVDKGVQGLYLCGSSGECIYQSPAERRLILETVMEEAAGQCTVIAHVGAPSTRDSIALARHAESMHVNAISSIPPIYYKLPEHAIADYWNAMSDAAPDTDFIIYNIPQLAGVALTPALFRTMMQNPRVVGVKNSSMAVQDIEQFKQAGGEDFAVFNGPDEQFVAGRVMGADGGIGGTYGVMPELFLAADEAVRAGRFEEARAIQFDINNIIYALCGCHCNMYAALKGVLKLQGIDVGGVRAPFTALAEQDMPTVLACMQQIEDAKARWCSAAVPA